MPSNTTIKQLRYLLSNNSPLSVEQKENIKNEIDNGTITIRKPVKKKKKQLYKRK